jgi:hypothetical protein
MAVKVEFNEALGVVEVTYTGRTALAEFVQTTRAAVELARERNSRLYLLDTSESEPTISHAALQDLPSKQYVELQVDPRSRIAIVQPGRPEALPSARFYETVCVNRGWNARMFATRDEAVAWLRAGSS